VYVNIFAVDANLSDGTGCDIWYQFTLSPAGTAGSTLTFTDPTAASSYLYYVTNPFTPSALYSEIHGPNPVWKWTDATFQFSCETAMLTCGEGGGIWEGFSGSGCAVNCQTSSSTSWSPTYCALVGSAAWTSAGNCYMNNVQVDFY